MSVSPTAPITALAVAAALALALAPASVAVAQQRGPDQRQILIELAEVVGQSHALRQACRPGDQFWRGRMQRLLDAEHPDPQLETTLKEAFNTGFHRAQAQYPRCDEASRFALSGAAEQGRELADELARTTTPATAVAEDATPR